jgi:hypothetical protein
MADIAQHIRKVIDNGTYKPRVDDLPYYTGPIPRLICKQGV